MKKTLVMFLTRLISLQYFSVTRKQRAQIYRPMCCRVSKEIQLIFFSSFILFFRRHFHRIPRNSEQKFSKFCLISRKILSEFCGNKNSIAIRDSSRFQGVSASIPLSPYISFHLFRSLSLTPIIQQNGMIKP